MDDGESRRLPRRPTRSWGKALTMYVALSLAWASTALIVLRVESKWSLLLGAFTPLPGVLIGGLLAGGSDAAASGLADTNESATTMKWLKMGLSAFVYSLLILSPGLGWLRTRRPLWLVPLVTLWGASAISSLFWYFYLLLTALRMSD